MVRWQSAIFYRALCALSGAIYTANERRRRSRGCHGERWPRAVLRSLSVESVYNEMIVILKARVFGKSSLTLCVRPMSICMCVWVFGEVPLCVLEGLFREFRWDESCIDRPNYLQLQIVVVVLSISLLWNTHTYEEIALMRNRIEWWDITFLSCLF